MSEITESTQSLKRRLQQLESRWDSSLTYSDLAEKKKIQRELDMRRVRIQYGDIDNIKTYQQARED